MDDLAQDIEHTFTIVKAGIQRMIDEKAALEEKYATLVLGLRPMVEEWRTASKQEWCEEGREAYEGCADELNAALDDAEGK